MTALFPATSHRKVASSTFNQWAVLTERVVLNLYNTGQFFVAIVTPIIFTYGFYLPLRFVMRLQGIDYAQYVVPIVALQTMAFTMMSNAHIAAWESVTGLNSRLQTLPVGTLVPFAARITGGVLRSCVSLAVAIAFGYIIGFRFQAGVWQAILFVVFTIGFGTILSIGADALGVITRNAESLAQTLALPTLVFGMLSVGLVPETAFPEWIRPFVRNQPISQFAISMREMTTDGVTWQTVWPSLVWLGGLAAVFVPLAAWASRRRG